MISARQIGAIVCLSILYGCASFQVSGDFQSGRQALLTLRDADALAYFQRTVEQDPNYVFVYDLYHEGIWTYLGRAQYQVGRFEDARQSLEGALSRDRDEYLARLYLGLASVRLGNESQGYKDIQSGLQGTFDFLQYMESTRPLPALWDPAREIRSEALNGINMISGKDVEPAKVIETAEWVGRKMEEEVDRVKRDEELLRQRGFPPGRGGVGVGIGF
jgi:tetratricopeptide (TPR) repeat protein